MSDQIGRQPQRGKISIPLRPFTQGIIRNVSPTMVPIGALYDVNGFLPTTSGLTRRQGFSILESVDPVDETRYDYIDSFTNDDGSKTTFCVAGGKFYELAGSVFLERPCIYDNADDSPTSTIEALDNTISIIGTNTTFSTASIQTGDILVVDPTGTPREYTVDTISNDLNLTVSELITPAIAPGTDFYIRRLLYPAPEWQITIERIDRILYICTGTRPLMGYDIDNPDRVQPIDFDRNFIPKTIFVFNDRLWCGNIYIPSDYPGNTNPSRWITYRISWSKIIPDSGYTPAVTGAVDLDPLEHFVDLIDIGGEISGLEILGAYLAVFFEFGLYYGRETQVPGDTLPLAFEAINSGDRGILQPGAVTVTRNGIFFVSTDNVYFLGENLKVVAISEAIDEVMFRPEILATRYKIHNFKEANGLVIGAGFNENTYDEFWVYNLHTKAWTRFTYSSAYFNIFTIGSRLTYANYPDGQIYGVEPPGQNDGALGQPLPDSPALGTLVPIQPPIDLPQYPLTDYTLENAIYAGESSVQTNDRFYVTVGPYILVLNADADTDQDGAPIYCLLETGDFDFGRPDQNKTVYRVALRLYATAPVDIQFHVEGSLDSGQTWWDLCDLWIFEGGKEGKSNFQFTGSAPRLRLTSQSLTSQYEIVEVTLEVKGRGKQFSDT